MNRRDLLKSGMIAAGAAALGLAGCNKADESNNALKRDNFEIIPKQTDVYKISAPMLFHYPAIDKLAECNKKYEKIKVETLYNSIPWPQASNFNEWFTLFRGGSNPDIKTFDDYARYIDYSRNKGFKVVYLMNSPKAFNDKDIAPLRGAFYKLLDNLYRIGLTQIKVANTQVAQLINEYNPNFKLSASTIFEYHSIIQYKGLIKRFPNINHIGVTKDENQNFRLLKALRETFPDITLEMMIDEGCLKGCYSRMSCMASSYSTYYKLGCKDSSEWPALCVYKNGALHPWDLPYYSAIGINNFKTVPEQQRASDKTQDHVVIFMDVVEYGEKSEYYKKYVAAALPIKRVLQHMSVKEALSYFNNMEYYVKFGDRCHTQCGVTCNYCDTRARELDRLNKLFAEKDGEEPDKQV